MKTRTVFLALALLLTLSVTACAGQPESSMARDQATMPDSIAYDEAGAYEMEAMEEEMAVANVDMGAPAPSALTQTAGQVPADRLIIKDGDITLEVEETEPSVDAATDILLSLGGYVISQNVYTSGEQKFANIRFGVPSAEFESAMRQLGTLGEVLNESASGQDVTDEFVDLSARLENLEATQDRLRTFLEEAQNTEETLMVYRELRQIEEEINVIKGRLEYLQDRASFSTINLEIQPVPLEPTAREPEPWRPALALENAWTALVSVTQQVVDGAIYFGIVCVPWLLIVGVVAFIVWRIVRRIRNRRRAARVATDTTQQEASAE